MKVPVISLVAFLIVVGLLQANETHVVKTQEANAAYMKLAEEVKTEADIKKTIDVVEETVNEEVYESPIDFESLESKNADVVAWIKIEDSVVDYPVMFDGSDNYLYRDFNNQYSAAGSIYIDMDADPNVLMKQPLNIIYGHHMKNDSMFAAIDDYTNADYYNAHKDIKIYTAETVYDLEPMACVVGPGDGMLQEIENLEDLQSFCSDKIIAVGELKEYEELYVLVTCNYWDTDYRTYLFCTAK